MNRIYQAKYFLTNSFHGTVFSILFKKNFFTVPNKNQIGLNARFIELLESLELDHRLINSEKDIDREITKETKFSNAFYLLEERKKESLLYINKAVLND